MPWRITAEPTQEPVTVSDAAAFARVSDPQDYAQIAAMITSARKELEFRLNRQLVTATYELYLDAFPGLTGKIRLPHPPLASVSSIKYYDTDSVLQTLSAEEYDVNTIDEPGQVYPAYDCYWPTSRGHPLDVVITFVTGWPLSNGEPTTPEPLREWIRRRVSALFEHRESIVTGTIVSPLPAEFERGLLVDYLLPEAV